MWFLLSIAAFASANGDVKSGQRALEAEDHDDAIKLISRGIDAGLKPTMELKARSSRLRGVLAHPVTKVKITHLAIAITDYRWIQKIRPGAPLLVAAQSDLALTTTEAAQAAMVGAQAPCVQSIPTHDPALPIAVLSGLAQCASAVSDYTGGRAVATDLLAAMEYAKTLDAQPLEALVRLAMRMMVHEELDAGLALLDAIETQLGGVRRTLDAQQTDISPVRLAAHLASELSARLATHTARAEVLHRLQRKEEALSELDAVIALDPASVAARTLKGVLLLELERDEEALHVLNEATKLDPRSPAAFEVLGAYWFTHVRATQAEIAELSSRDRKGRKALQIRESEQLDQARQAFEDAVSAGSDATGLLAICGLQEDGACLERLAE